MSTDHKFDNKLTSKAKKVVGTPPTISSYRPKAKPTKPKAPEAGRRKEQKTPSKAELVPGQPSPGTPSGTTNTPTAARLLCGYRTRTRQRPAHAAPARAAIRACPPAIRAAPRPPRAHRLLP